jgi:hypothetical protein
MEDKGVEKERTELLQEQIYLKIDFDFIKDTAKFYYSYNETDWVEFGTELAMRYMLPHFMGYRFEIFNFATKKQGGYVDIDFFRFAPELTGSKTKSNSEDCHSYGTAGRRCLYLRRFMRVFRYYHILILCNRLTYTMDKS